MGLGEEEGGAIEELILRARGKEATRGRVRGEAGFEEEEEGSWRVGGDQKWEVAK